MRKPKQIKPHTFASELLFSQAKAHFEEIERLVEQYNEIADALDDMGYAGEEVAEGESFPHIGLTCNGCRPMESELIVDAWNRGRVGKQAEATTIRRPVIAARAQLGAQCGWACYYCGRVGDSETGPDGRVWHVDHSYPVSRGGDNGKDNLVLACATCNLEKRAKTANEYFQRMREQYSGPIA